MARIVLASANPAPTALLRNAGIEFTAKPAAIDEREIESGLVANGASPVEIAVGLADAKARAVSTEDSDALTIGADQVLALGGQRFHKPANLVEARAQLEALSGRTHHLLSAVSVARNGKGVWRHHDDAALTMRRLPADEINSYLALAGERALSSVGAYQVEGPAIRLFERIDGDYFTILGLPLLPLLAFLREEGVLK